MNRLGKIMQRKGGTDRLKKTTKLTKSETEYLLLCRIGDIVRGLPETACTVI